jgi:hypothetical protein
MALFRLNLASFAPLLLSYMKIKKYTLAVDETLYLPLPYVQKGGKGKKYSRKGAKHISYALVYV